MTQKDPLKILNAVAQTIYDKKGINILALDLRDVSTICDFVIIAEGNVDKHVNAIAQAVSMTLKEMGETPISIEGQKDGDWVAIDCLNLMVHLFKPGYRDIYRLEDLWREGKIVDLTIDLAPKESAGFY